MCLVLVLVVIECMDCCSMLGTSSKYAGEGDIEVMQMIFLSLAFNSVTFLATDE